MTDRPKRWEPITLEVAAYELPESIVSRFPKRPAASTRFAVTVEPAESDAEKLASLKEDLQAGLEDLEAGRVSAAADVFSRLKKRYPVA